MDPVKHETMKTAVALAQANLRGDAEAMLTLWNSTPDADMPHLVGAMAALPSLVIKGIEAWQDVEWDADDYYRNVLTLLNRADGEADQE